MMAAKHPLTGKPIRLMTARNQLHKDAKTLVFLKKDADPLVKWGRWETLAVGLDTITTLKKKGIPVHISVLLNEAAVTGEKLKELSLDSHLLIVSQKVIATISPSEYEKLNLGNIMCLEEFESLFAYLGPAWDGSEEDAAILITGVLRYSRIAGIDSACSSAIKRKKRLGEIGISFIGVDARPHELWLIQQYFRPDKTKRAHEIKKCLEMNVMCPIIDKIVLLNEADYSPDYPASSFTSDGQGKIQQIILGKRLCYSDVIRYIYESVPDNILVVFSNSDIYLDPSLSSIWSLNMDDKFLSLLRWDVPEDMTSESVLFGPRADSQDTWILSSRGVKARKWDFKSIEIPFGKNGCDNAFNTEMMRNKYLVSNPAYSIKTHHLHNSGLRTYNPKDIVDKPVFLHVEPTGLNDMEAKESFSSDIILQKKTYKPFPRILKSVQKKEIDTFCTMLKRGEVYEFVKGSENIYTGPADTLLQLKDCFITENGLPYKHQQLIVGPSKKAQRLWSETPIGGCRPTIHSELTLVAPLTKEEMASPEAFCLKYVSRILQLIAWDEEKKSEFLCPKNESYINILRLFKWPRAEIPVLPVDPEMNIYSDKAIVWTASDSSEVTSEDIDALRRLFNGGWLPAPFNDTTKIVIIQDSKIVDKEFIGTLENKLESDGLQLGSEIEFGFDVRVIFPEKTSLDRIADGLRGASYLIYANDKANKKIWPFQWMLPTGATVIEVQDEMNPQGDGVHLAGACGLNHHLIINRKGIREYTIRDCLKHMISTMSLGPVDTQLNNKDNDKPVVWLPRSDIQGYFGHPGDSFREMARIWGQRGYCYVKEHPTATLCWWGDIGKTLLYDRPTMDWLTTAPPAEQSYLFGLFGNPTPPSFPSSSSSLSPSKVSSWSFWPRRPTFVEELVSAGIQKRGWSERAKRIVFYGRVENRVQERRRIPKDGSSWSSHCDDFIMPKGADVKYALSQKDYLIALSESKFGLCLAGYGRKCHREVELMAMGTVPIVEKEVDVLGYAEPLVEGLHYFRVEGPEDIEKVLGGIDEAQWILSSEACKSWWSRNASAEGMFLLTQRLIGSTLKN